MSNWKFVTLEKDGRYLLEAKPGPGMESYIQKCTERLISLCSLHEEHLILQAAPTETLERLQIAIEKELANREGKL